MALFDNAGDNPYAIDAVRNLKRAAALISDEMTDEAVEDATLHFAFGVERCLKAIIYQVNPVFVLDNASFDNAAAALYRRHMAPKHREAADKEAAKGEGAHKSYVIAFAASLVRARKFSETAERNSGLLNKLSDFRGIFAHRPLNQISYSQVTIFLGRVFQPIVKELREELRLDVEEIF
jgi:hypothetical protein